jgi:hypothetical protein
VNAAQRGERDRTERQGGSARVVETRDERLERGLEEQDVGEREAEVAPPPHAATGRGRAP